MECGARLPAGVRFCNVCGTKVVQPEPPEPAPPASAESPAAEQETGQDIAASPAGEPDAGVDDVPPSETTEPPVDQPAPETVAPAAAAVASEPAADTDENKYVWGDTPADDEPGVGAAAPAAAAGAAVAASEISEARQEDQPTAALDQGDEIVETRRYPPREEVRREDLDEYRRQQQAETTEVEPYYREEGGLGIRPGILMATIGFAVALAGVFLPWVSLEGTDVKALDDSITAQIAGREVEGEFEFQIQDALDSDERLDGYIVIALCAVGIFLLFIEYVFLRRVPIGRVYAALGGLAVGALGVVELLYIRDVVPDEVSFSYEPGLFMVTIGGAAAIVGSLIPVGSGED